VASLAESSPLTTVVVKFYAVQWMSSLRTEIDRSCVSGTYRASATKTFLPFSNFHEPPQPSELTILRLAEKSRSLGVFAYSSKLH